MTDHLASIARELSPQSARRRFEQARRDGHANWLWPDVAVADWRAATADIANVARKVLAGESGAILACADVKTASVACYTSGMGPLLGYWTENGLVKAATPIAEVLQLHLSHNRQRMDGLSHVALEVSEILASEGIPLLISKGMHTAFEYFPEPATRPLSDIDMHIPMKSMPAAERILSGLGYRRALRTRSPYACDWTLHSLRREPRTLTFVHRDDPWSLDVQGSLNRRLPTGSKIRLDRLLASLGLAAWPLSSKVRAMRQPMLLLYLAAHVSQILLNATLLRAVELLFVIRKDVASGRLDWHEFLRGAEKIGGGRFVYPALAFCEQLAPGTVPGDVLSACRADAPANLRRVVENLSVGAAQPLGRYSLRERFMWAENRRARLRQVLGELALDGRRPPLRQAFYSIGTKLWALRRGRYTA